MESIRNEHDILPVKGSVKKAITGEPADMLNPFNYPLIALCICGRHIRIERYFMCEWVHVTN